jgi:nuclear pore complex protein Nup93
MFVYCRYQGLPIQAAAESVAAFYTLRDLMVFFDQFHNDQYQNALRVSLLIKVLLITF